MVMKKNAMRKNLRQSIKKSLGRYIAIAAIIALGAGLFLGLLMTKADMIATGQYFMDRQKMFDLRLMNSYGWTEEYVQEIAALEGIAETEGVRYIDLIARLKGEETDSVFRFLEIPQTLNQVALRGGRMPEKPNECLADGFHYGKALLGKEIVLSETNEEDALDSVTQRTFTVVGYVATPLYMDMNRGTTSVGSGSLASFFYVPKEALDMEYYTEINITIPGEYAIYSEEYQDALDAASDALEPELQALADRRLEEVRQEALEAYQDGIKEYSEGLVEFAEGKAEADRELADALRQLEDGEQQIIDNEQLLHDAEDQLAQAELMLMEGEKQLRQGRQQLAAGKAAAYQQVTASSTALLAEMQTLTNSLEDIKNEITGVGPKVIEVTTQMIPLESSVALAQTAISQTQGMIGVLDFSIAAAQQALNLAIQQGGEGSFAAAKLRRDIEDLQQTREKYSQTLASQNAAKAELDAKLNALLVKKQELENTRANLEASAAQLETSIKNITEKLVEVAATKALMENEFNAAEAQLEAGEAKIEAGYLELDIQAQTIANGLLALEESRKELDEGWAEYKDGKAEAEAELADGRAKLQDAAAELADAWEMIDGMTENEIIILDRSSNVGYNNLDSSSDIVAGVSRVIPVFFLLVASLVCITTMTRMIEEERTQIGTLKALGYSNGAIISKYMFYSGSGAVMGCGLGILAGSTIFPKIIWQAYSIMLYIQPNMILTVNWTWSLAIVVIYTGVMLFVTWYCCHRTLEEVPAELIRPKSPDAGKKILMEYLPFWHKISFLNKVTIRNIFRYRQRLAMMLVGIGGCTALLLTGFGLRDSITNVVNYQFDNVTLYDMSVYFREEVTEEEKAEFESIVRNSAQAHMFYHQSSLELEFDDRVKEIYMISGDNQLETFVNLYRNGRDLSLPGRDELVLSIGVAENLGIKEGDTVLLRNSDMQTLELTVSALYENHVYNYCIIAPETIQEHWGHAPQLQMAFVQMREGEDVHELSARLSEESNVMNVAISQDMADMVGGMMDALDLVVWVIVFCAGLLAVIVLYNLTNININERIREIATIKVLGFNAGETAAYVFKENMTLTVVGSAFGLLLGRLLLAFVMTQIKIDMVWIKTLIESVSYVWSIVLTILSAIVVNFIFYFKLEKINMAEALKSVE